MARIDLVTERWMGTVCDYLYDPIMGNPPSLIKPRTFFVSVPGYWACPDCGARKIDFVPHVDGNHEGYRNCSH